MKSKFRTGAHIMNNDLGSNQIIRGKYFDFDFEKSKNTHGFNGQTELIILAENETKAQQAFELYISSLALLEGNAVYSYDNLPSVHNSALNDEELYEFKRNRKVIQLSMGLYDAALIAAKASFRKAHYICLYKYLMACSLHSNYFIDLDPFHAGYEKLSGNPLDHLRYCQAILILYSIIEELQIEIQASSKNPSKINEEWNPIVKKDLLDRIKNANIDVSQKALWNLRSRPTKIHDKKKLKLLKKASWAKYSIKDSYIEIIDAIAYLSWLRSKKIAHKMQDGFMSVSIYDVANANFLIRQFLLDILLDKKKSTSLFNDKLKTK